MFVIHATVKSHQLQKTTIIDEDDEQIIEWVACDSCAEWHHVACVEIKST